MVRRVLDSLMSSRVVSDIVMAGPEAEELATDAGLSQLVSDGAVSWRPPASSMKLACTRISPLPC